MRVCGTVFEVMHVVSVTMRSSAINVSLFITSQKFGCATCQVLAAEFLVREEPCGAR